MNSFLKKTALFLSACILLFVVSLILLVRINEAAFSGYRIPGGKDAVVLGDSHTQVAINDALMPNAVNLSQSSEPLKFSYFKALTILKNNPSVKTVYLGFGYHSVSSCINDNIFGKHSKDVASRYFMILPVDEKINIVKDNWKELPVFFKNTFSNGLGAVSPGRKIYSFIGVYDNKFFNTTVSEKVMQKRLKSQFYESAGLRGFSDVNISYLLKIAGLCREHNVKLVLLNTPLHSYYKERVPEKFKTKYYSLITENNFQLEEFNNLPLPDSCFIPDGDHVSETGASILTNYLKSRNKK